MSLRMLTVGFLIGIVCGIRWAYHDIEIAGEKWKEYKSAQPSIPLEYDTGRNK